MGFGVIADDFGDGWAEPLPVGGVARELAAFLGDDESMVEIEGGHGRAHHLADDGRGFRRHFAFDR